MSWKNSALISLLVLLVLSACQPEEERFIPDVSDLEVDLELRRFEQDLFVLDTQDLASGLARLEADYPDFAPVFFEYVLRSKDPAVAPEGHEAYVKGFLTHPAVRRLYDTTQTVYPAMPEIEAEFEQAFRFFRYYFPTEAVPDVTTFLSEYTIAAFIYGDENDNSLAVGLDFFLGADYPYQRYNPGNPVFSEYLVRTFNREHLVVKTLHPLLDDLLGPPPGDRLIDLMIHNGKKLYLTDLLLPYAPDSVKLEMTPEQVQWLEDNELEMWAYFLDEELFYNNDWQKIRKLVEYSPHSPGMPPEAPGRTANWVGRQVVEAYMQRFPETTPRELIELRDVQALVDASRYKPGR